MELNFVGKIFWVLAAICLFSVLNLVGQIKSVDTLPVEVEQRTAHSDDKVNEQQSHPDSKILSAYWDAVKTKDPTEKLSKVNNVLIMASGIDSVDPKILFNLHLMAAKIHEQRWHIHFAIESYQQAHQIINREELAAHINRLTQRLANHQKERDFNQEYVAMRNSGPAKSLRGRVLVAYVFIDDGISTRWSDKDILFTQQVMSQVQSWQDEQAAKFGIANIEYINKHFLIKRNPALKLLASLSYKSKIVDIEKFVDIAIRHLGGESVAEFLNFQMEKYQADQVMLIFHSNFERRSFARRCYITHRKMIIVQGVASVESSSNCSDEYVMMMEKTERNRWDKLHYVMAHESLHLFGADDLYSISGARNYAVTDIMNYQSRYLEDSQIDPITAFAIGWLETPPPAPFKILEM